MHDVAVLDDVILPFDAQLADILYLVRWPDLSAALLKASSEDELVEMIVTPANWTLTQVSREVRFHQVKRSPPSAP